MSSPMSEPTRLVPVPQPGTPTLAPHVPPLHPEWIGRTGQQRIGDAERSAVCEALSGHYAAGRLGDEELDARVDAAMAARTEAELRRVVADLPSAAPRPSAPAPAPVPWRAPWSGFDVLALVTFIGALGIAFLGAMAVLGVGQPEVVAVAVLTTITAGAGGMALTQLLHRARRSVEDRAVARIQANRPR